MNNNENWQPVNNNSEGVEVGGGAEITAAATKRMTIAISADVKRLLHDMSKATGIPQANLAQMAVVSMLANYDEHGLAIFSSLLNVKRQKWLSSSP